MYRNSDGLRSTGRITTPSSSAASRSGGNSFSRMNLEARKPPGVGLDVAVADEDPVALSLRPLSPSLRYPISSRALHVDVEQRGYRSRRIRRRIAGQQTFEFLPVSHAQV